MPNWLKTLAESFKGNGFELYIVGGAVRNAIIGIDVAEWDLTTNALPDQIEAILRKHTRSVGLIGKRFGTITAVIDSNQVEVTTYRGETYQTSSRHPVVSFGKSLLEDLARRDFTINAIAQNPTSNELIDPNHGQDDIKQKIVRAVGDAEERFNEDPLRMLRAVRFATKLGFNIEELTLNSIILQKAQIPSLSSERISYELDQVLLSDNPSSGVKLLVETGLISYILPELIPCIDLEFDPKEHKDIYQHILQVLDQTPPTLELRWTAILHDIAKPLTRKKIGNDYHFLGHEVVGARLAKDILRRLKYSNDFINYVAKLVYLHQRIPNNDGHWTDGAVRRFVRDAGETLQDLFTFAEADSTGSNTRKLERYSQMRQTLLKRIDDLNKEAEIAKISSPLSGEELMKMFNRKPGAWIKPIKAELLKLVLDGELSQDDKEKALEIAHKLVKN